MRRSRGRMGGLTVSLGRFFPAGAGRGIQGTAFLENFSSEDKSNRHKAKTDT